MEMNIRLKMTVSGISKTDKFDANGEPVYMVNNNFLIQVKLPKLS